MVAQPNAAHGPGGPSARSPRRDAGANWTFLVIAWFALNFAAREILGHVSSLYGSMRQAEYLIWTAVLLVSIVLCYRLGRDFRESEMASRMLQSRIREARASSGSYRPKSAFEGLHDLHGLTLASRDREYELSYESRMSRMLAYLLAASFVVAALLAESLLRRGLLAQASIMIFGAGLLFIFTYICALISSRKLKAADALSALQHDIEEATGYYHKTQQRQKRDERDHRRPFFLPPR